MTVNKYRGTLPPREGLYDPANEHDACGVGFVVNIQGMRSHEIITQAIGVLKNLAHRGACGCDPETGDGAGILLQIPHELFAATLKTQGIALPEPGYYGVGMLFLPQEPAERARYEAILTQTIAEEGQTLLGWRDVPTDNTKIGRAARETEPVIRQVFIGRSPDLPDQDAFERKLFVIRRVAQNEIARLRLPNESAFYVCSMSSRTIVYKGLLMAEQIAPYYADLRDPRTVTALALVHQRFSTNTFPTWDLAHPYRYIAHNGEINTLRGNRNWMRAREKSIRSDLFGDDICKILPLVNRSGSDSATLDNAVELLTLGGRSLPHVMMMLIPEAWASDTHMDPDRRAFYEYHACLMEPWDGPAAVAFTDGQVIGAVLDRNGLRPARYLVTEDGLVVMASETGVIDIPPERVIQKGRLQPGKIFLVDTVEKRIVSDEEIKRRICTRKPYRQWLAENKVDLKNLPPVAHQQPPDSEPLRTRQAVFGYTLEDLRFILKPMAEKGEQPIGSMGTDTPLAVLSNRPQLLYNYFKQLFAQVTNPPIDPIREELVMSLDDYIGRDGNLFDETPEHCRQLRLDSPILTNADLEKLRHIRTRNFRTQTLPIWFFADGGERALEDAVEKLRQAASKAVRDGYSFLILSDRGVNEHTVPIPALLAVSAVHHHLVREGCRTQVGLIVETGEAREVMHFALLIGYGASAVNPYLAFETLADMVRDGTIEGVTVEQAEYNFIKAASKGLLKTFAKMGISTLQSYRGAQIFEAIGLDAAMVEEYFTGTVSRIGGIGLDVIQQEAIARHEFAYPRVKVPETLELDPGGQYQWRRGGEYHQYNPDTVAKLQHAVRQALPATERLPDMQSAAWQKGYRTFKEFTQAANDTSRQLCTLRGLLRFKKGNPIPLEEVEPASEIVKRFATGAMSLGSISREAHETLAIAMNRIGGKSNTGEGGEDPVRYEPLPNGDSKRSAIKQVASARFGVTTHYLVNADELQIKMAQGAKPGEGGELPGHKVDRYIAQVRHTTPGVTLISPPPHHDIYSIEDLAQLIFDLKNVNPQARISVKLVAEVGVGTVAAGVAKAHADHVLISGHDGGTGASPLSSIKHAGSPWEMGLAETQQVLVKNDLRSRIVVQTDGQLKTGRDVVIAALLGAEEFGFSSAPLVAMGCIMMRVCHLNTCPVGIATQDPVLRQRFAGLPEHVINYFFFVAEEVREIMAELGFRRMDEMIGRMDMLDIADVHEHWKARGIDLRPLLTMPDVPPTVGHRCLIPQDHGLATAIDYHLIALAQDALQEGKRVSLSLPIYNRNRTVGTMLSGEIVKKWGAEGLPDNTIKLKFYGSAGQSFGAFLARGVTMRLEGDANDYLGKGLSGGRIIVYPPRNAHPAFDAAENIIAGNTLLYGATSGEVYLRGTVGERFAVRNSGAIAVVEGVGDHGCEYMTGGVVVVLGRTGRNFAAGMSGGEAFVWDPNNDFEQRVNFNNGLIELEPVTYPQDVELLRSLIEKHLRYTRSDRAALILQNWKDALPQFKKVVSVEYRRARLEMARAEMAGESLQTTR
ncbi:MAG: glutamate synthase large subunit [Chloroherpetonaceae bacterium]|nr:glutamate synthase large subunit [Chthonomonadaceae bacterium]MDW8208644.1 glutamate synthase large subunit [Chloroherpetonaceae bacterium]